MFLGNDIQFVIALLFVLINILHYDVTVCVSFCRDDTKAGVIDSLEVVSLSRDAPVRKYAEQHRLPVHHWPDVDFSAQFDVGVVVSFGCLIKENIINKMP